MKKAIIIIISALVVLGGVFAGLWFFTDILNFLKPANQNFAVQLDKVLGTEKNLSYSEYESKISKLKLDGSYSTDMNMSMNVNLPSSVLSYSDQKLLNSSSLNLKTAYDADKKVTAVDIGLLKDSQDIIRAQAIVDGVKLSINSKDLYDKYLTFDLSKYESFCQQNNIEVDKDTKAAIEMLSKLNEVDTSTLAYDLCHVSEKDYNALQKRYDDLFVQLVDKDKFKAKKNQKITVGDKDDVKTTAYSVTLTGEDAYKAADKLIDLMKDDDTLKRVVVEKYNLVKGYAETYEDIYSEYDKTATSTKLPELTESDIADALSELSEELDYVKGDLKDMKGAIKITIYSDKKNNPVKLEVALLEDEDDDDEIVIFTKEIEKGKDTYTIDLSHFTNTISTRSMSNPVDYSSSYSSSSYSSSSYSTPSYSTSTSDSVLSALSSISAIKIVDEYEKSDDSRKGTLTISAKATDSKFQKILTVDYEYVNSDSEFKLKLSVRVPSQSSVSLDLNYAMTGLNTDTKNLTFDLSAKYLSYSVSMNVNGTMKSGADIPEMTSQNSVDILTLNQEELKKVLTDVVNNAANSLPAKLNNYGIKVTKEEILSILPAEQPAEQPAEAPAEVPAA